MTDLIALRNKLSSILTEGEDGDAVARTMIKMYLDARVQGDNHEAAVNMVQDNIGAHYDEEEIEDYSMGEFDRAVEKYADMTSEEVKASRAAR